MGDIESIFKVMPYYFARSWRKLQYPEFKTKVLETLYMRTCEEVDAYMIKHSNYYVEFKEKVPEFKSSIYAYVVLEIPLGFETNVDVLGENLSTRIYLPDGSLWGENRYADFVPMSSHGDEYNYWGRRNMFGGRKLEEIRFKPGDIVEVMGYPGNHYWGNDSVNLAIVVKTPPTVDEVAAMRKQYLSTHSGFDICDHAMCYEFGYHLDTYEVLSFACNQIDHAPTISVFKPTKPVSSRRKKTLMDLYNNCLKDL